MGKAQRSSAPDPSKADLGETHTQSPSWPRRNSLASLTFQSGGNWAPNPKAGNILSLTRGRRKTTVRQLDRGLQPPTLTLPKLPTQGCPLRPHTPRDKEKALLPPPGKLCSNALLTPNPPLGTRCGLSPPTLVADTELLTSRSGASFQILPKLGPHAATKPVTMVVTGTGWLELPFRAGKNSLKLVGIQGPSSSSPGTQSHLLPPALPPTIFPQPWPPATCCPQTYLAP